LLNVKLAVHHDFVLKISCFYSKFDRSFRLIATVLHFTRKNVSNTYLSVGNFVRAAEMQLTTKTVGHKQGAGH